MLEMNNTESLCQLPASDGNFEYTLKRAAIEEIISAVAIMECRNGKDKGRIVACRRELRRRNAER